MTARDLSDAEQQYLDSLRIACADLNLSLEDALSEKTQELRLRHFLRCLPNDRVKEADVEDFLRRVLGREPEDGLKLRVQASERGVRLPESDIIDLEERQCGRCALCGVVLDRKAEPHIDHIVPVALCGRSELANYQILCRKCNLGKGKLVNWIMGAPFFIDKSDELTQRLRFCVLAFCQGRCSIPECTSSAKDTPLDVIPIVDIAHGGRWIFDNLTSMCQEHAEERRKALKSGLLRKLYVARHWQRFPPPRRSTN